MFSKIVIALNDQPESQCALRSAIDLARAENAKRTTVSILGDLPAYRSFAIVVDPGAPIAMKEDHRHFHDELNESASKLAQEHGLDATGAKEVNADLLVIGLHQHDFYLSRLWSSVYDLAQDATCSVLGVH